MFNCSNLSGFKHIGHVLHFHFSCSSCLGCNRATDLDHHSVSIDTYRLASLHSICCSLSCGGVPAFVSCGSVDFLAILHICFVSSFHGLAELDSNNCIHTELESTESHCSNEVERMPTLYLASSACSNHIHCNSFVCCRMHDKKDRIESRNLARNYHNH